MKSSKISHFDEKKLRDQNFPPPKFRAAPQILGVWPPPKSISSGTLARPCPDPAQTLPRPCPDPAQTLPRPPLRTPPRPLLGPKIGTSGPIFGGLPRPWPDPAQTLARPPEMAPRPLPGPDPRIPARTPENGSKLPKSLKTAQIAQNCHFSKKMGSDRHFRKKWSSGSFSLTLASFLLACISRRELCEPTHQ